ncbi:MAG: UPF0182 family protein [Gemmatimonadetes bacterium]|nr:UPF0182 family protein [Gemmatimonadota bacterium]
MTPRRAWVRAAVLLALLGLLVGRWAAVSVANRLWAESLGVGVTHTAIAQLKLTLLGLAFATAATWSLGNLYLIYRTIGSVQVPRRLGNLEIVEAVPRRYLVAGTVVLGLLIAVLVSHRASGWWYSFALLGSRAPVELVDPVLHRDLTYYLFRLPWERTLHGFLATLSAVLLVVTAGLYALVGAIRVAERRLVVADWARTHLAGLLVVFALTLAAGFRLDPAEYVAGLRNVPYDAVLVEVRLPFSRALSGVAVVVAIASLAWIWVDRNTLVVAPWGVLAGLALAGTFVVPGFATAVRGPDRLALPELVAAQRRMLSVAFALPAGDTTIDPPPSPDADLPARRASELGLVPIWDAGALQDLLRRLAPQGPEHRFAGAGLDLYQGRNRRPVALYLAAREVDLLAAREADAALSWSSVHAGRYAHASGAIAVAAAQATPDGLPLVVPDLTRPGAGAPQFAELDLAHREVWFSPAAEEYALGRAPERQVGIAPAGIGRRLALAWTLQSPRLLTAGAVPAGDLVLWHRAVAARLDRYAPFARFGAPYPVVAGRRLLWLAWGHVSSETFPLSVLSQWRGRGLRYLRTSLVGVVDAYSGETQVYLVDDPDPISAAWAALAPDIVRPVDRLPELLRRHLRYPEELFAAQVPLAMAGVPGGWPGVRRLPARGRGGDDTTLTAPREPVWLAGTLPGDDRLRLRLRQVAERGEPGMLAVVADGYVDGTRPVLRVVRLAQPLAHRGPSRFAAETAGDLSPSAAAAGPVTTLVFAGGIVSFRPVLALPTREEGVPRLQELVAGSGGALGRGAGAVAALRDLGATARYAGGSTADWGAAREWFRRLDAARRAGDWAAFGRAYEQLRRLLRAPTDSAP